MELIRGIENIRPSHRGCVLTIGNFDGVHVGHRAIIERLLERSTHYGLPSTVMVFEPQPQELFMGTDGPTRLLSLREKYQELKALGVDRLVCMRFKASLATMTAQQFIVELLAERLGVTCLLVGDDFHFGHQREGDYEMLVQAGAAMGFDVQNSHSIELDAARISSTLIRGALKKDLLQEAASMLGHPYRIRGKVCHGDELGRTIGFPTANIKLSRRVLPMAGVYLVDVIRCQERFPAVANMGFRPTVGGLEPRLEVHLLDFNEDLYREQLTIEFRQKLRDEKKFNSFSELKQQILRDVEIARSILQSSSSN